MSQLKKDLELIERWLAMNPVRNCVQCCIFNEKKWKVYLCDEYGNQVAEGNGITLVEAIYKVVCNFVPGLENDKRNITTVVGNWPERLGK